MKTFERITELIGGTPLLELKSFEKENNLSAKILQSLNILILQEV